MDWLNERVARLLQKLLETAMTSARKVEDAQANQILGNGTKEDLYRQYDLVFERFKMDADFLYRRVQMTLALQAGLLAAYGYAFNLRSNLLTALISCLGAVLCVFWMAYAQEMRQYLEFRKRMLRDLEARIGNGINPMTVEKDVFYLNKTHEFSSGERFPDRSGDFSLSRFRVGITKLELLAALPFFVVWIILLVIGILLVKCQAPVCG